MGEFLGGWRDLQITFKSAEILHGIIFQHKELSSGWPIVISKMYFFWDTLVRRTLLDVPWSGCRGSSPCWWSRSRGSEPPAPAPSPRSPPAPTRKLITPSVTVFKRGRCALPVLACVLPDLQAPCPNYEKTKLQTKLLFPPSPPTLILQNVIAIVFSDTYFRSPYFVSFVH